MFGNVKWKAKYLTGADLCLILGILALAAFLAAFFFAASARHEMAEAVIEQDGQEILRLPLAEERTVRIPWEDGFNTVTVTQQGVFMSEADCPDQICVRQGTICNGGESIVCLPHRLVIRLEGTDGNALDAMTN